MYVSSWPGLGARELLPWQSGRTLPYPFNNTHQLAFCVARSGIYHLFRALELKPNDVVLVPDYHSGNEVAAIRAAGATITFYPVRRNLEPDLEELSRLARRLRPRVIYAIHYLGWPQPLSEIEALCQEQGSILIEDCALSLLSTIDRGPLGAFGDYSIFCLYKTLPVPNGGLLVQNHATLHQLDGLKLESCPRLSTLGRTAELALETVRSRADRIGKALFAFKQSVGSALRRGGARRVPVGDIGWDIANVKIGMSPISNTVVKGLDYFQIRKKRRENYLFLLDRLRNRVQMLREDLDEGVCPLFFPILVDDKHAAAKALWAKDIGAVEFWNDRLNYAIGPEAEFLRAHVLELPIHQGVSSHQAEYICDQVLRLNLRPAEC
jgi:dTDP-4-amino-4,6-dideoxygalactose transaminase